MFKGQKIIKSHLNYITSSFSLLLLSDLRWLLGDIWQRCHTTLISSFLALKMLYLIMKSSNQPVSLAISLLAEASFSWYLAGKNTREQVSASSMAVSGNLWAYHNYSLLPKKSSKVHLKLWHNNELIRHCICTYTYLQPSRVNN